MVRRFGLFLSVAWGRVFMAHAEASFRRIHQEKSSPITVIAKQGGHSRSVRVGNVRLRLCCMSATGPVADVAVICFRARSRHIYPKSSLSHLVRAE